MGFMGHGYGTGGRRCNASQLYSMGTQVPKQESVRFLRRTLEMFLRQRRQHGKFCAECGKPAPAGVVGWKCECGTVNKSKFCVGCGKKKPDGAPKYKCDKCGWEPEDLAKPPKFCPECGDPFDENDKI